MSSQITLGPFVSLPKVEAGTDKKVYIDPFNTSAYVIMSTSGGGQPTTAPVSGVIVDLCPASSGAVWNAIPIGGGLYTAASGKSGKVNFFLPDMYDSTHDAYVYRVSYPAGAWDSTKPTFTYIYTAKLDKLSTR